MFQLEDIVVLAIANDATELIPVPTVPGRPHVNLLFTSGCSGNAPYLPHRCPISFKIRDIYGTYTRHPIFWPLLGCLSPALQVGVIGKVPGVF
jgi:hypothetical protein